MKIITKDWYGVFNSKGELEAVHEALYDANFAARQLSPVIEGKRHLNRFVMKILIGLPEDNESLVREDHSREAILLSKPTIPPSKES